VRYLILAAGMGKRMRPPGPLSRSPAGTRREIGPPAQLPKCLIEIDGEPLIGRLVRQIRTHDPTADVRVVLGYRADVVAPHVAGCEIVLNPFFDVTGINASLWFARAAFSAPLMVLHGDVVLSDELATALLGARAESLVAFDSRVQDPREINVAVDGDRITRFGVNFAGYSGAYAGVLKLSAYAANVFAVTLARRVERGFNEARNYYFFVLRTLIADPQVVLAPFDFARHRWKEIDVPEDVALAQDRCGSGGSDGR
jgi:choline kinase